MEARRLGVCPQLEVALDITCAKFTVGGRHNCLGGAGMCATVKHKEMSVVRGVVGGVKEKLRAKTSGRWPNRGDVALKVM